MAINIKYRIQLRNLSGKMTKFRRNRRIAVSVFFTYRGKPFRLIRKPRRYKHKPDGGAIIKRFFARQKALKENFVSIPTFVSQLQREYDITQFQRIYHTSPRTDVVHKNTSFVWTERSLPFNKHLLAVRMWSLVAMKQDDEPVEYQVWAHSFALPYAMGFNRVYDYMVDKLLDKVKEWTDSAGNTRKTSETFEHVEIVAWTAYPYRSRRKQRRK